MGGYLNEREAMIVFAALLYARICDQQVNVDYDIALVKLTGSIPLSDSMVAAAKLPDLKKGSPWPPYNLQCAISGWGCTCTGGSGQEGDAGSGLVCKYGSQYYVVGVLSTGAVESEHLPSFFVRVSYFIEWINHTIQTN
ncbi:hypothetical protein PHET_06387 [Paragonimus heterotremus]|uniref:Peptidase S1 domain-containing protein n=1 Tax=Paragonimus heterotremus TaxID=100268 RepID=A0A8J4WLS5_9TREM|nr:hypothetical protein PHET_06387 [Paragonimus heterotremus]